MTRGRSFRSIAGIVLCAVVVAACGDSSRPSSQPTPVPAPRIALSAADRARWAPGRPSASMVPVLVYRGIVASDTTAFARQMVLLHHAGYRTIDLATFVRLLRGEDVARPARPFLLTFDDGRVDSWSGSDGILRELGFEATIFVDVGRVAAGDPAYLSWDQLNALQRSGRWDVQLQSGTGKRFIQYGPARRDVGSFYAYRGSEEVLGGWRERVFGDLAWAERQLARRVRGYRPLAFAPPYGNFGQAGTNDARIPRLLLTRLLGSFQVVFTQDRPALAVIGARSASPVGRLAVTGRDAEARLHALVQFERRRSG
jgi:peptidoglycan/xylan/chitin deacetylase (PgdA/CDA1 family)